MGNIGTEVAHKLEVFGCEISYYDPYASNFKYKRYDVLEDLIENNDIITIHCDLNKTSHHLIDEKEMNFMHNKILINTARGSIINNNTLVEYLKNMNNIYVGLDVFEKEPLPKSHYFRKHDNVICSSHNTNTSQKFWKNVHNNSIKMLKEELL
jgi:phosphoglycerate dehydrogenase-like enzyme